MAGCEQSVKDNKTITITDVNATTISFSITAVTDANISTEISSGNISIGGITSSVSVSLTAGTLVLNGTDLNTTSTTITADDNISIKLTSSGSYGTMVSTNLTVGSVTKTFSVTTMTNQPTAFSFTTKTGADLSTYYDSNITTVSGLVSGSTVTAVLSSTGSAVLIKNSTALPELNTTVQNNDTIEIRLRSSSSYSTAVSATLTIASQSASYSIVTMSPPTASINIVMDKSGGDAHYAETDVVSIVDVVLNTQGTKAYMANSSGIVITDINSSESTYMTTLGSFEINTTKNVAITSDASRLFVASGYEGLVELNVTDASSIVQLANYSSDYSTSSKFAWSVTLSGDEDTAYVANCAGVDVFDVSNPSAISRLDELNISGGNCAGVWLDLYKYDIAIDDGRNTAYLAYGNQGVKTLKIIDPTNIEVNATYSDLACTDARSIELSSDGNTFFVACGTDGVQVVNVIDPTSPSFLATYTLAASGAKADHVRLSNDGNSLYVAHGAGVEIVDVSTVASPVLISSYSSLGNAYATAPDNNDTYFYLGDGSNGLLKLQLN